MTFDGVSFALGIIAGVAIVFVVIAVVFKFME